MKIKLYFLLSCLVATNIVISGPKKSTQQLQPKQPTSPTNTAVAASAKGPQSDIPVQPSTPPAPGDTPTSENDGAVGGHSQPAGTVPLATQVRPKTPEQTRAQPTASESSKKTIDDTILKYLTPQELNKLTEANVQDIEKRIKEALDEDWDLTSDHDPSSKQMPPSRLDIICNLPKNIWQEYIDSEYRVERLLVFAGYKRTYEILLAKAATGELDDFIKDLNKKNSDEGHRWFTEALHQATDEKKEGIVRQLTTKLYKFLSGVPVTTKNAAAAYLKLCSESKRKALAEQLKEYLEDQESLASLVTTLEATAIPKENRRDVGEIEQHAQQAALGLTRFGSHDTLPPRAISPRQT